MHSSAYDFLVGDQLPEILESHQQLTVLDRCCQLIHASQRGPADASSIRGKSGAMAGANKLVLLLVPRDGTAEVGTDRCEHAQLALTVFRHVNCFFRYCFTPSIHLFYLNGAHRRL